MTLNTVINTEQLSKIYKLYDDPLDRLKETFHPFNKQYHQQFYALNDITCSIKQGEIVGIVGKNGSGKSTLLQIITGVLTPTSGTFEVKGKISALLELGAGFNPELTGLENVYFKSSLLGYSKKETETKLDSILEFAEIGDFVKQPVKMYSSGMFVRLAFAVAINVEPDILIIDEALSVGDFRFQQKCMRKFDSFLKDNKTILFVSHDHGSVLRYCNRAIWLRDGKIFQDGTPNDVCKDYIAFMSYGDTFLKKTEKHPLVDYKNAHSTYSTVHPDKEQIEWQKIDSCKSFGQGGAVIRQVAFFAKNDGRKIVFFEGGERVVFCLEFEAKKNIPQLIVGFHLSNAKGIHLFGLNNIAAGIELPPVSIGEVKVIQFEFNFPFLKDDTYSFSPAIAEGSQDDHIQHHWVYDAYMIRVISEDPLAHLGNQLVLKKNFEIRLL